MNAVAVAFLIATTLQPIVSGHLQPAMAALGFGLFLAFQALLHYVLGRVED